MNKVATVILTYNDQDRILHCIKTAQKLSDIIIVVDINSKDNTIYLAKALGCIILTTAPTNTKKDEFRDIYSHKWHLYEWIIYLNPKEYLNKDLIRELLYIIHSEQANQYIFFYNKIWLTKNKYTGFFTLYYTSLRMIHLKMFSTKHKFNLFNNNKIISTSRKNYFSYIINETAYYLSNQTILWALAHKKNILSLKLNSNLKNLINNRFIIKIKLTIIKICYNFVYYQLILKHLIFTIFNKNFK